MSGIAAPKIIVIPQSLLQSQTSQGKSLLRLFPQGKAITTSVTSVPQYSNIVTKPPTLTINNNNSFSMARPVATVMGQKRPAPVNSADTDCIVIKEEMDDDDRGPVRKRANLDHMSPEERLMRRKLKNRVAAQTARDKKRAHMEEMEVVVERLREEKRRLQDDNNRMQATNNQLQIDNAALIQENQDLRARLALDVKIEPDTQDHMPSPSSLPHDLPPSPVSLPRSPLPPVSPPLRPETQTPPESAAGAGHLCGGERARPRVVVQRLDDLAVGSLRGVVGHAPHDDHQPQFLGSFPGGPGQEQQQQEQGGDGAAGADIVAAAARAAAIAAHQEERFSLVESGAEGVESDDEGVAAGVNFPLLDLSLEPLVDTHHLIDAPILPNLMDTPVMMETTIDTPTAETILDKFLESHNIDIENRWAGDLEDLFPDLV